MKKPKLYPTPDEGLPRDFFYVLGVRADGHMKLYTKPTRSLPRALEWYDYLAERHPAPGAVQLNVVYTGPKLIEPNSEENIVARQADQYFTEFWKKFVESKVSTLTKRERAKIKKQGFSE